MASKLFTSNIKSLIQINCTKILPTWTCNYSSYQTSKDITEFVPSVKDYEVSKLKHEWQFVERLLPPLTVPKPIPQESYSTEWRPPTARPGDHKYYVNRNRNHLIPVYLLTTYRGMRKITEVVKIYGDIHAMEKDLKKVIEKNTGQCVASQINELVGSIKFKGDHIQIIKKYLSEKGF